MLASDSQYSSSVIKIETVRAWPIIVGAGLIGHLEKHFDFSGYSSIVLITDTNVEKRYGQYVMKALTATGKQTYLFTLPVGERAKSLRVAERIYTSLLENSIDRKALICTLGGGVVGDIGGYVAATYLRGVDYIQLPTTLLAQVDSSIGGKVGVNFSGKKNMIGSFYQPKAIICDVNFLKSLSPAEIRNGLAEVIKYALAMDEELLGLLEQKDKLEFTPAELMAIVTRCANLKARIVEVDEREQHGERAILNFGHTVGHAIEAVTGFGRQRHGEAIAIGMVAAGRISQRLGMLDKASVNKIEKLLLKFGLPAHCPEVTPDELLRAIAYDKKTTLGQTGWVLLQSMGKGVVNQTVPETMVIEVLKEICR
jgi:3-dehydroquinate synthase